MKLIRGASEALTLAGVVKKQGRYPEEKDLGILKKPIVVTDKNKILFVGTEKKFNSFYQDHKRQLKQVSEVKLDGEQLLPGFVESHTHSVFAGDRQNDFEWRNRGETYQSVAQKGGGIRSTVRHTKAASEERLLELTKSRFLEFKKQGVVLLECKSGYGLSHKQEIKALKAINNIKIKNLEIIPTYLGLHSIPETGDKDKYVSESLEKTLPYVEKNKLARRADIFVEKNYFTTEDLEKLVKKIKAWNWSFCAHTEQMTHTGGTAKAIELGAQSVEHCVQVTDRDIECLANSDTVANLLPAADFYLKMNYPPARKMLEAGVRISLATDFNPGTSPTQSLNFVGVLARLEMRMTRAEVFAAYTYNAASALGKQRQYGALLPSYSSKILCSKTPWTEMFYQVGLDPKIKVI